MELTDYRDRFPILAETTYLISHSLGPMPIEAERRLAEYAASWNTRGPRAWGEGWWDLPLTVGDQIGRLIGAPPGSTVMQLNVTTAEAIVLSCFDLRGERRRIVYEEENFPSVRYLQQAQAARGAEIVVCPDEEAIIEAIDERTLLVPISHVIFRSSRIQDVEPIIRRAHEVGAYVVLDAYQSVGALPLDVTELGVDFAVGGSVKWLCGGPGAAWLYVRPDLADTLEPTLVGWQAHKRPFAFEPELEYADGAARFLTGTPNVPALYAATAGYDIIEEIGVERIRAQLDAPDGALHAAPRGRPASTSSALASPSAAEARWSCARPTSRPSTPSSRAAASSATSGLTPASASARTSSRPTRRSSSPSSSITEILGRGATLPAPAGTG